MTLAEVATDTGSLAATLRRVSVLGPYFAGSVGRDPALDAAGWVTAADLCDDGGEALERLLATVGRRSGTAERRIEGSFLVGAYAWSAVAPVVASYLLERRVPSLAHDNVAVWTNPAEGPGRLALRTDAFTALATDASAGAPAVRVVDDEDALRTVLHDEVVGHLAPILGAVRARTSLGVRALWLNVGDQVGNALHYAGQRAGKEAAAIREAVALLHRPGSLLDSPRSRFATYGHLAERRTVRVRGGCCLNYRIPGEACCMTCPLVGEAERAQRVIDWIADDARDAE